MKILYLMKILLEDTDKEHILNASELCDRMQSRYSMACNRKTIYGDMERLPSRAETSCRCGAVLKVHYKGRVGGAHQKAGKAHKPGKCKEAAETGLHYQSDKDCERGGSSLR